MPSTFRHLPYTTLFRSLFDYGDIRWVGNEDGRIPYENWNVIDRHGFLRWRPAEADTPLRKGHWFWSANAEDTIKSVGELLAVRSEEHTSELQSHSDLVCPLHLDTCPTRRSSDLYLIMAISAGSATRMEEFPTRTGT